MVSFVDKMFKKMQGAFEADRAQSGQRANRSANRDKGPFASQTDAIGYGSGTLGNRSAWLGQTHKRTLSAINTRNTD